MHHALLRAPFWRYVLGATLLFLWLLTATAFAVEAGTADPTPSGRLVLPTDQLWALLAGAVTPLFTYLLNTYAPWTSEAIKSFVLAVGAAVGAGIVQALTTGDVGFNQVTLQFIATGVIAAFIAHANIWIRNGVAQSFGSGENRNLSRSTTK